MQQRQEGLSLLRGVARARGDYDYASGLVDEDGKLLVKWGDLNIEEQASVVQDIYVLQNATPEEIAGLPLYLRPQINNLGLLLKLVPNGVLSRSIDPTECFPAHTAILTSLTSSTAISALRVGDIVLAYDARANNGRGALTPRRIRRLYRNTTTEWIVLTWVEDGQPRELTLTPGHHVLDQYGQFPTIEAMLRDGVATVVLASGALAQVTAERVVYSAATAHLYQRARSVGVMAGNVALQPVLMDAW